MFSVALVWLTLIGADYNWYGDAWVPLLGAGWVAATFASLSRYLSRDTRRGTIGGSPGPSGATTQQRRPRWATPLRARTSAAASPPRLTN